MKLPVQQRGQRVIRLVATEVLDSYGEPKGLSWDAPRRTPLRGAWLQERSSTEVMTDGSTRTTSRTVLYLPGNAPLTHRDRVEVDGQVWQVDGDPTSHRDGRRVVYREATLVKAGG